MNERQLEKLVEVAEKVSSWLDHQKKMTRLVWLILLIPLGTMAVISGLYFKNKYKNNVAAQQPLTWFDVQRAEREHDFDRAVKIANLLLIETPLDFEGHYKKGILLLKTGEREQALESFKRARELFPINTYKDAVTALESTLPH